MKKTLATAFLSGLVKRSPRAKAFLFPLVLMAAALVVVFTMLAFVTVTAKVSARALWWTLTGPRRNLLAPLWLIALVVAVPGQPGWYLGAALLLDILTLRSVVRRTPGRKVLAVRERALVARVLAVIALLHAVGAYTEWSWTTGFLADVVVIACAAPAWWRGRRIRRGETNLSDLKTVQTIWEQEVVAAVPALEGQWVKYDPDLNTGVLQLDRTKASVAAKLDEDVEFALKRGRGTVTIADDPTLGNVTLVRIAFQEPEQIAAVRYWAGSTFDQKTGTIIAGYSAGQVPVRLPIRSKSGAMHMAVIGPSGNGKGGFARLVLTELILLDDVLVFVIDGKGGAGVPSVRDHVTEYGRNAKQWEKIVDRVVAILRSRKQRYSDEGWDSFRPGPGEPQIVLWIDESKNVFAAKSSLIDKLEEIASQGRSLGISLCLATQFGDQTGYGSTEIRSNLIGINGSLWAGKAMDAVGRSLMAQNFNMNTDALPMAPGWAFLRSAGDTQSPPMRTAFIPTRRDIEDDEEFEAPFGTIEDWLTRAMFPDLHVADEAAALLVGPLCGREPQEAMDEAGRPAMPSGKKDSKGKAAVREALASQSARKMAAVIAKQVGMTPRHVRDILEDLAREGFCSKDGNGFWATEDLWGQLGEQDEREAA